MESSTDPFVKSATTQAHINADTDSTAEALHHTLGKGITQAAPGNHKHKYSELADEAPGVPPPDPSSFVKKTGDTMSGKLQIDNSKGVTLHNPGNSVVSIGAQLQSGAYCLEVTNTWDADTGTYAPVAAGYPLQSDHLARVDWVDANFANAGLPSQVGIVVGTWNIGTLTGGQEVTVDVGKPDGSAVLLTVQHNSTYIFATADTLSGTVVRFNCRNSTASTTHTNVKVYYMFVPNA